MQSIHVHFRHLAFKTEDFNGSEQLGIADKRNVCQTLQCSANAEVSVFLADETLAREYQRPGVSSKNSQSTGFGGDRLIGYNHIAYAGSRKPYFFVRG
jgi:hypothetical protein